MPWGLEIAPDRIRLCRADARRGRIRLRGAAEAPVPAGLLQPSLKDGNLKDSAATTQALRDLGQRVGCRGWVRVALPDPVFLLRTIVTDDLPEDRTAARRFLGWQVRDLLPFPSEEARLDYLQAGRAPDGRLRVTCLIAHERVLAEYERTLQGADLSAAMLDARSVALAQAASTLLAYPSVALLTADGPRATLLILQDGRPRLWRILPLDGAGDATGVRLIREVADSLAFFRETEEDVEAVHRMFIHGLGQRTAEIGSELARWLSFPVTTLDLTAVLASGTGPRGLSDELTRWGAALGAAIRPW
jgi:Tfp pilus assembly PilM family ATPase